MTHLEALKPAFSEQEKLRITHDLKRMVDWVKRTRLPDLGSGMLFITSVHTSVRLLTLSVSEGREVDDECTVFAESMICRMLKSEDTTFGSDCILEPAMKPESLKPSYSEYGGGFRTPQRIFFYASLISVELGEALTLTLAVRTDDLSPDTAHNIALERGNQYYPALHQKFLVS